MHFLSDFYRKIKRIIIIRYTIRNIYYSGFNVFFCFQSILFAKTLFKIEDMTTVDSKQNEMYSKPSKSNFGDFSSSFYDSSPEYLQKWIEGYALLVVIIVGATANLFSLIIIRNKELNLIRDFSRLLQSQVMFVFGVPGSFNIWLILSNQLALSPKLTFITLCLIDI